MRGELKIMKSKSVAMILGSVMVVVLLCILGRMVYVSSNKYSEDADYLINFLDNNFPLFQQEKDTIGYDFNLEKKKLLKKISKSRDDVEFYDNVSKTLTLLQNRHCSVLDSGAVNGILPVNYSDINVSKDEYHEKLKYWDNIKINNMLFPDIIYNYIEGKYVVVESNNVDIKKGYIITMIDNIPIDKYVKTHLDLVSLQYDVKRNCFYDIGGNLFVRIRNVNSEDILISVLDTDNRVKNCKVKLSHISSNSFTMNYIKSVKSEENVVTNLIDKSTAYIRVKEMNFNEKDTKVIDEFFHFITESSYKNVIIDIRRNAGGSGVALNKLIEKINIGNNKELNNYYCYRKGEMINRYLNNDMRSFFGGAEEVKSSILDESGDKYKILKQKAHIEHSSSAFTGRVYILVDGKVYSSSSTFLSLVKRASLGTIVGTNTGDGGIGTSPIMMVLPQSKLTFRMQSCTGVTSIEEKQYYDIKGITPDIYVEQKLDDYISALKNNVEDIRCTRYDTMYNKCLQVIQSN